MKDTIKRALFAVIMSVLMIAGGFMPFNDITAQAETLPDFNPEAAVTFAKNNTKNYKDCVKFARACAEKGGVPRQKEVKSYSPKEYMDYLTTCGYAVKNELTLDKTDDINVRINEKNKIANLLYEENLGKLAPGDLLVYKCKKCGKYFHMAIVTETSNTVDYYREETPYHAWMIEAQTTGGAVLKKGQPFYRFNHKVKKGTKKISHGRDNVVVYALHFTSAYSGFDPCEEKVGTLTAKKITKKKVRLKWPEVEGAVAYNIYARGYIGGPVLFQKQVKSNNLKVAIPRNKSGKYYNYKNVRYTVAPVFEKEVTFESVTKTYRVVGKKRALVKVK